MVFANGLPALPRKDARRGDFGDEAAVGGGSGKAGCALGHSERLCLVRVATPNAISTSETSSSAEETSAVVSMSTGIISSRSSATEMPASAAMAGRRRSSKRAFAMVTVKGTDSEFEK